ARKPAARSALEQVAAGAWARKPAAGSALEQVAVALEHVVLHAGVLSVSVHKLEAGQAFVVVMPDGELEVRGTRFLVRVEHGHTEQVQVDEGRVALRLRDATEVSLDRGQAWSAPTTATNPPHSTSSSVASTSSGAQPAGADSERSELSRTNLSGERAPASARQRTATRAPSGRPTPLRQLKEGEINAASEPTSNAPRDFRAAMALFSRGDFDSAERAFKDFEQRYPTNQHNEDILFLMALGRSRRGDDAGARSFARDYLRRYPQGFRAAEAARLAGQSEP
ncbi:MAG: FecR domain-containing protein, partial [Myxococcota bacterium]